jgi:hypothetical protein
VERQMTIKEIESEFDSEWVLVQDPETNEGREVVGGKVLHHSKDRDEVYRRAIAMTQRPKRFAILFTGSMPEGTAVVL